MAKELSVIERAEQEERQRFNELIALIAPLFFGIDGVSGFARVRRGYERDVDRYIRGYNSRIKAEITDAIKGIDSRLSAKKYIDEAFNTQFKIKGSRVTIDLDQILLRRGLKVKGDITAEIVRRTGFATPSEATVNAIKKAVLDRNKKSMAQIVGNEMHKAREQAKIDDLVGQGFGPRVKAFVYNTQGDDRVRPKHAAFSGTELTLSEAQKARDTLLTDIGCRCFLTEL